MPTTLRIKSTDDAANTHREALAQRVFTSLGLRWCDIPHEREARIVSKRIAEDLFGPEAVRQHIDARIANPATEQHDVDWKCIRKLSASIPDDLFERNKAALSTAEGL